MTDQSTIPIDMPATAIVMTVASVKELNQWRAGASPGEAFCYYSSSSSLMRARSWDVAVDIGNAVWTMYLSGRCLPVCMRTNQGWNYLAQATENPPVQPSIWAEPPTKMKKTKAAA